MLELYIPQLDDLWFKQQMEADPATMAYNANWDVDYPGYDRDTGYIDFSRDQWIDWHIAWVGNEPACFYAYLRRISDDAWIGEVNFHYNPDRGWWDMGVVLFAPYRGQGYGAKALQQLLDHAFRTCRIERLHNDFEIARNEISAWKCHLSNGFRITGTENGWLHMEITREEYLGKTGPDEDSMAIFQGLTP